MPRSRQLAVWLLAAALGAGAALLAAIIGVIGIFVVLLIIPGMGARTWLAATSGALMGFGATMLASLFVRLTTGGAGTDGTLLILVSALSLVVGLVLGALALVAAKGRTS